MKKATKVLSIVVIAALSLVSCGKDNGGDDELSAAELSLKAAVEEYVPGVIYSIYGNLADASSNLYDQLLTLKKAGTASLTDAQIENVCKTFLDARAYWEKSEAFLFGAATVYGIDPHIDSWPLDKDKLAKELSNSVVIADLDEEGAAACDEVGKANLGFHGIEFILFRNGAPRKAADFLANETDEAFASYTVSGETELIFATAVAEDLRNYCWELQAAWDPSCPASRREYVEDELELNTVMSSGLTFGENLLAAGDAGSTYSTWQRAVSDILTAGCSDICAEVANSKIASAFYHKTEEDADYIESPYSKKSYQDFYDNIQSIVYSLYGKAGATSPSSRSIYNVLQKHGYNGLSNLKTALDAAVASLQACLYSGKAFVDDPSAECAGNAIEAINDLDDEINKAANWVSLL